MYQQTTALHRAMLASLRPSLAGGSEALSISEQIAMQLADEIVNERYMPNDRLQEIGISERYKVSRGPVREALRILENAGLVTIAPRRGAIVTQLSAKEVADVFDIRAVLAGLGARRLAETRSKDDIDMLRRHLATLNKLAKKTGPKASADYVDAVVEFGLSISEASGNERLNSMVTLLFHQTLRYSRLGLSSPERRVQSCENWSELVDHIAAGRGAQAEQTARRLVEESKVHAIRLLREEKDAAP
ncbi:GntR family transcriptional regulator [Ruegeria pomeroyi]|nr:GntR family transcriptional regulator [Ruegeria pomeroyi]